MQGRLQGMKPKQPKRLPEESTEQQLQQLVVKCKAGQQLGFRADTDMEHAGKLFMDLLRAQLPCMICQKAAGQLEFADVKQAKTLRPGFVALLKLQAAWHAHCIKQERFSAVAEACKVMASWCRGHDCGAQQYVAAYCAQAQALCKDVHGLTLHVTSA